MLVLREKKTEFYMYSFWDAKIIIIFYKLKVKSHTNNVTLFSRKYSLHSGSLQNKLS